MRERATAEIEAEKQRAIAELRGEVADLALQAAGRVVGETMTDDRQRRLVEEFLAERRRRPATERERADGHVATPRRAATPRPPSRSPTRDGTVETWRSRARRGRRELAATTGADGVLANPAMPLEQRTERSPSSVFAGLGSRSATSSCSSSGAAGSSSCRASPPSSAGSTTSARDRPRHRHERRAPRPTTRSEALTRPPRADDRRPRSRSRPTSTRACSAGSIVRVGDRLIDGSVRGRLERLRNQLASGALLGDHSHGHPFRRDHQHHQVLDRLVRRRRSRRAASARSSRSATASPRSTASTARSPRSCSSSRAASWAWP